MFDYMNDNMFAYALAFMLFANSDNQFLRFGL